MNKSKKLTALFTGTAAVLMLTGTSAFADYRHRAETRSNPQPAQQQSAQHRSDSQQSGNGRVQGESGRRWDRSQSQPQSQTQVNTQRGWDRAQLQTQPETRQFNTSQQPNDRRGNSSRNDNRSYDRRGNDSSRGGSYDRRGNNSNRGGSYNRAPARNESRYYSGRVSRVERYNSGFRVWVGGAPYPFFISAERWAHFPIRIGVNVRLGGYWDPLGYYNVYDAGPYATAGDLHGLVESVDYRQGTVELRDDVSGSFVTVVLRGNDPRLGDLRPGDYVDLTGSWNRAGVFEAYNVAQIGGGAGYGSSPNGY